MEIYRGQSLIMHTHLRLRGKWASDIRLVNVSCTVLHLVLTHMTAVNSSYLYLHFVCEVSAVG